jgi:hypothetical protein
MQCSVNFVWRLFPLGGRISQLSTAGMTAYLTAIVVFSFPRCIFQPERHQVLGGRFEHVLRHDELGADATKMCVFVVIEGKIVASFARNDLPLVVLTPVCVAVFLADGSEVGLHLVVGGIGDRRTVLFAAATQCKPSVVLRLLTLPDS